MTGKAGKVAMFFVAVVVVYLFIFNVSLLAP